MLPSLSTGTGSPSVGPVVSIIDIPLRAPSVARGTSRATPRRPPSGPSIAWLVTASRPSGGRKSTPLPVLSRRQNEAVPAGRTLTGHMPIRIRREAQGSSAFSAGARGCAAEGIPPFAFITGAERAPRRTCSRVRRGEKVLHAGTAGSAGRLESRVERVRDREWSPAEAAQQSRRTVSARGRRIPSLLRVPVEAAGSARGQDVDPLDDSEGMLTTAANAAAHTSGTRFIGHRRATVGT